MTRFFLSLYDFFSHNRGKLFCFLLVLIVLLGYAASHIQFKEDISSFLPVNKENSRINDAYKYVATANNITVYIAGKDSSEESEALQIEAIDELADRLQQNDSAKIIKSLFYPSIVVGCINKWKITISYNLMNFRVLNFNITRMPTFIHGAN